MDSDVHSAQRLVALLVIGGTLLSQHTVLSAMQPGALVKAWQSSKNQEERIERYCAILHDEIANPTERRKGGGGGYIDHDYQMAQIITGLENLLMPAAAQGATGPQKKDVAYLKTVLEREKIQEAKEILQIVLALCGEPDFCEEVVLIVRQEGRPHVRRAAVSALWQAGCKAAIPDLVLCLSDPSESVSKDYVQGGTERVFLIRRAAAFVLRKFGVSVTESKGGQYQADGKAAVRVLEKELEDASHEKAQRLLKAIRRVGGPHAEEALKSFVEKNKTRVQQDKLVSQAKDLLQELRRKDQQ